MPTYHHKETGKRFLFVHIPRTAGRFIQENIILNGYEPEQIIWEPIEGVEISHLHRELYEKYLDVEYLEQIAIVRDPVERYISLKSHPHHPKGWFRPQVDYINMKTHLWRFEDGFGDAFADWMGEILQNDFIIQPLESKFLHNIHGQPILLEYMQPEYKKIIKTDAVVDYVKLHYKDDFTMIYNYTL